jgi:hypothetical protein
MNNMMSKPDPKAKKQVAAFRKAARELGCDDNENRFKETLRALVKNKPKDKPKK